MKRIKAEVWTKEAAEKEGEPRNEMTNGKNKLQNVRCITKFTHRGGRGRAGGTIR